METNAKKNRYERIYLQLKDLFNEKQTPVARMATVSSLLHHKMDEFFWTGFYLLENDELTVGPYQGPLACIKLKKNTGVCWASINKNMAIIVPDVHEFPGHIACDSRSNSEIAIPVSNKKAQILAVLDIDSRKFSNFDKTDAEELQKIISLIYSE